MTTFAIRGDESGATAVEFGLTAPLFFAVLFGIIQGALLLWTQLGLQHGAAMAARCASINKTLCGTSADVQKYAAQQAYGLNPDPTTFAVSTAACGNQVVASYTFSFLTTSFGSSSVVLSGKSCFPT